MKEDIRTFLEEQYEPCGCVGFCGHTYRGTTLHKAFQKERGLVGLVPGYVLFYGEIRNLGYTVVSGYDWSSTASVRKIRKKVSG